MGSILAYVKSESPARMNGRGRQCHNYGALEEIRTPDLRLRRPTLYPLSHKRNIKIITHGIIVAKNHRKELDTRIMAVYNFIPHHLIAQITE